jgi:8-oxo-dGTP diphosphatase
MPISEFLKGLRAKVGHELLLLPAVTAVVLNDGGDVLLQKSADTNDWRLIGGVIDPGEDPAQCAIREVKEEAGIDVAPRRILGVHTRPLVTYPNGDQVFYVSTSFLCHAKPGEPRVCDDESLAMRYFAVDELPQLIPLDRRLIDLARSHDAFADFRLPGA